MACTSRFRPRIPNLRGGARLRRRWRSCVFGAFKKATSSGTASMTSLHQLRVTKAHLQGVQASLQSLLGRRTALGSVGQVGASGTGKIFG